METYQAMMLETLADSVATSLEGLAFVDVEDWKEVEDFSRWQGKGYHTYLDIDEPLKMRFHLLIDEELTREIVSTILAEEPENLTEDLIGDTLGEILNTLAGKFSGDLEESEPVIGLPYWRRIDGIPGFLLRNGEKNTIVRFQLDLGTLYCVLERQEY